jgi:hypothetical protein
MAGPGDTAESLLAFLCSQAEKLIAGIHSMEEGGSVAMGLCGPGKEVISAPLANKYLDSPEAVRVLETEVLPKLVGRFGIRILGLLMISTWEPQFDVDRWLVPTAGQDTPRDAVRVHVISASQQVHRWAFVDAVPTTGLLAVSPPWRALVEDGYETRLGTNFGPTLGALRGADVTQP